MALYKLFKSGIALTQKNAEELEKALVSGKRFFNKFNETRMQLAFSAFTPEMKKALYEVIYFLHVNDSSFEKIKYRGVKVERISGIVRETVYQTTANLYFPDTLHGVVGIDKLPITFREDFHDYIAEQFGVDPQKKPDTDFCPIISISSLGSIGTIGHKPENSDLDLQILYDLKPFKIDINEWSDDRLKDAMSQEIKSWISRLSLQQNMDQVSLSKQPTLYKQLRQKAIVNIGRMYPYLYQTFFKNKDLTNALASPQGRHLKMNIILEMMNLISGSIKNENSSEHINRENALKLRIQAIQSYIEAKFPKTEVNLFVCDINSFRNGQHGTTVESKEASGSAYELILNYEVLMPGIQFVQAIPTHFIISKTFNNSPVFYERIINYIRFCCLPIYYSIDDYLIDTGATPSLSMTYMLSHVGAAYWESFKASSGNLPKALLNLFRIEVLYESNYSSTLINLIKNPNLLEKVVTSVVQESEDLSKIINNKIFGISVKELLLLEEEMPILRMDPWWIKYKVLKVFYSDLKIQVEHPERCSISRNIDLCFALHLKLSDALKLNEPHSHRERFLLNYLEAAFPNGSPQRLTMERIFIGEVQTINRFEKDLKNLFSNCLDRIHKIIAFRDIPDASNHEEFEIWYHYYQQHFDYGMHEIPKNILTHLKVPRATIKINYEKSRRLGNWVFNSTSEREQIKLNSRPQVDMLKDAVLIYEMSFLKGLAYCILNGYYGLLKVELTKEIKTDLEINLGAIDLGNVIDNHWSIIDTEIATRLADRIVSFFPYKKTHYMDCIRLDREVEEIFFFSHLFKFGRLSILYRDNFQAWEVMEFDHPDLALNAQTYFDKLQDFLNHPELHQSIDAFLKSNKINMTSRKLKTEYWYNFMATAHGQTLDNLHREKSFSWQFRESVLKFHGEKDYSSYEDIENNEVNISSFKVS